MDVLSSILGWTYFSAWSISFYPQLILNFIRKSAQGLSQDFCLLNTIGFACYGIYTLPLNGSDKARNEYRERWGSDPMIPIQDIFFAIHAFILTFIVLIQSVMYSRELKVSRWVEAFCFLISFFCLVFFIGALDDFFSFLDGLYFLSGVKMFITLTKYIPQVLLNWRNQSTVGWSIENILLDMAGGILSMTQQLLDAYIAKDMTVITGNPIKIGLGLASIAFDIIFILQHHVWYPSTLQTVSDEVVFNNEESEEQPLLAP